MPTENRRVAAYLPKYVDDKLREYKLQHGIKGDSEALIKILSEFLEVSHEVTYDVAHSSKFVSIQRFEELASQVSLLSEKLEMAIRLSGNPENSSLSELESELISEPDNKSLQQPEDEFFSGSPAALVIADEKPEALLSTHDIRFQQSELAKRLNVSPSTLSQRKGDATERFSQWSSKKDPNNISWSFASDSNRFHPISELSSELHQKLLEQSIKADEFPGTLATGDLAKRLGIAPSTLSHWKTGRKKGGSPDNLLKLTREKDPEGMGWIFLPDVNRFKPERASESSGVLQGDLLETQDIEEA